MAYKLNIRKSVADLFGKISKREILTVFKGENVSRATIYRAIKDCENGIKPENKPKSGRPPKLDKKTTKKLVAAAKDKVGQSSRRLGRKFGVSHVTAHRILKRNGVGRRARKRAPKYTGKQLIKIPKCCRALRTKHLKNDVAIIMDDEKYFTFANHTLSGNNFFYTDNYEAAPDHVKYSGKAKFEPKVLVWVAISEKGVSTSYITKSRGPAINADIYIKKCLPKMKKFISKEHLDRNFIFWPDLASSHYAKSTLDWLAKNNIPTVPKADNPPNVPQARPIENFWAVLSRLVYDGGWEAKTEKQLIGRIQRKLKEVDTDVIQRMMGKVKKILRKIEDNGPLAGM